MREEEKREDGIANPGGSGEEKKSEGDGGKGRVMAAINTVTSSGRSLYSLAVLSGNSEVMEEVHKILHENIDDEVSKKRTVRQNKLCGIYNLRFADFDAAGDAILGPLMDK